MTLVLLSGGLDSAVLLSYIGNAGEPITPVHVRCGYAWEYAEAHCIERLMKSALAPRLKPLCTIHVDMRDILPEGHWALTGIAPAYDTDDEEVYLAGRNITLLSKAAVLASQLRIRKIAIGLLKGNPFPDATPAFLTAMGRALTLGLAHDITIQTPFAEWTKSDVVRQARTVGLPLDLTISCMMPIGGRHCGQCSKCRERHDGFVKANLPDPTDYATRAFVDLGRLGSGSPKPY
ncbi:MAG TPA: 7-cyano-7-deazaguanine synthase [Vicinamibacterales bacterium]|nr:7-cyano-7-deazaguanine synthase [Vicinamibacterales bacterium]